MVITGAGDQAFCAGADLKAISRGEPIRPAGKEHWGFAGFVNHPSKPTIAAVNATALGGGTELLLASDLAVAVESANFGLPEVKRGLIAAPAGVPDRQAVASQTRAAAAAHRPSAARHGPCAGA